MKEKEARAFFVGEDTLIPLASERIYSPGRLQSAAGNLEEALRQQGYAEVDGDARATRKSTKPPAMSASGLPCRKAGAGW